MRRVDAADGSEARSLAFLPILGEVNSPQSFDPKELRGLG